VVGQNGPQQARRALRDGERAIGMHQTQDMIPKERPDGQGAEDAWGAKAARPDAGVIRP